MCNATSPGFQNTKLATPVVTIHRGQPTDLCRGRHADTAVDQKLHGMARVVEMVTLVRWSCLPLVAFCLVALFMPLQAHSSLIYGIGLAEDGANLGSSPNRMAPPASLSPAVFYDFRNLPKSPDATLGAEGWATLSYAISNGATASISASGSTAEGYNGALGSGGWIFGQGFNDITITFTLTSAFSYVGTVSTIGTGASVTGVPQGSGFLLPGDYAISAASLGGPVNYASLSNPGSSAGTDGFSFDLILTPLATIPPTVPEPSALAILGAGLTGLGWYRHRTTRRKGRGSASLSAVISISRSEAG
jgi:hypothetical protein